MNKNKSKSKSKSKSKNKGKKSRSYTGGTNRRSHRNGYPENMRHIINAVNTKTKQKAIQNNLLFDELKLDDGTEFLWMFLKNDDDTKLKLRKKFPILNDLFPFIKTYSFIDFSDFRDYLHNYINKPCKIIINFDNSIYYDIFKKMFRFDKEDKPRTIEEQNKIVKYLFSEFKGETNFYICSETNNILFYKVRELELILKITNKQKYFFYGDYSANDILSKMCIFYTEEELSDYPRSYCIYYYILMLFGSTTECDMNQINGKKIHNIDDISKIGTLPYIFNDPKYLSYNYNKYDIDQVTIRINKLLPIYEEYMREVIKL